MRRLRDRKGRRKERLVLVEGVRAVGEALSAGVEVRFVLVAPRLSTTPAGAALEARLPDSAVTGVSDEALGALADVGATQGVLLVCAEPDAPAVGLGPGRYLVLDAIQDPGNLGTLVRAAAAFALDGVIALDGCADPWGPKAVRASAGLAFRTTLLRMDAEEALGELSGAGVPVWVAAADGESPEPRAGAASFALVVGNEGAGVRSTVKAAAERTLAVSMPGGAESLNVGMAGAILLHELSREDRA